MADPTLVNGQITDAVTQTGVTALSSAPALGLAAEFQMGAHSIGLAMQNAVANQRQTTSLSGSAATQAVSQVLTLGPSQTARATAETLTGQTLVSELISLSAAIRAKRRGGGFRTAPPGPPEPDDLRPSPIVNLAAQPPSETDLAAAGEALIAAIRQLADAIRALAQTRTGGYRMYDPEALEAIRKAAERLNTNLEELHKHLAAGPPPDLWRRLIDATDDLRRATRMLEGCGRPPVPVGATPPGVVIVGSGNTHTATPRVVGASW